MKRQLKRLAVLLVGLFCAGLVYAQGPITISMLNERLESAIAKIEKQSGYSFLIRNNDIDLNRTVSIDAKNDNISQVMNQLLKGTGASYEVNGNRVVIYKAAPGKSKEQVTQQAGLKVKISGIVKDNTGEPVVGATVKVPGTTTGTITDIDGNFSLEVPHNSDVEISYIGFATQNLTASHSHSVDIVLKEDLHTINEVVVVGYGTMKRKDVTGSISTINGDELTVSSATNAATALQGKIAGVNIERNVGKPGGTFNIKVRGESSINNANASPLYVINGIPMTDGLNDLNPDDIESIDVLKDASATAIYGSRGANGVVIVTTKSGGQDGHFSISYDGYYGFRKASHLPDMMDGPEYVKWRTDLFSTMGRDTSRGNAEFFTSNEWDVIDSGRYTDWIDLTLRTGQQYSNTVTASGGDAKGSFAASIGQLSEEGTVKNQDYNRYNIHLNLTHKFLDKWSFGANTYFTYSIQNEGSYETLRSAYRLPPVAQPYDEDGNPKFHVFRNASATSPIFESQPDGERRENRRYNFFGNAWLQVEPVKGLTLKTQMSPHFKQERRGVSFGVHAKNAADSQAKTEARYNTDANFGFVWDNSLNYTRTFGDHHLTGTVVQSIEYNRWESTWQTTRNFPFNSLWYNLGAASKGDINTSDTDYKKSTLSSFLARVQYGYKDRYLFTVSGRYDGSSRLAKGHKWAFFPSAAFAWRVTEEKFMAPTQGWLSNLKFRLSYGVTGNDAVSIYGTQSSVSNYPYDFGGDVVQSYYKSSLANQNLTWEKTREINIGLDFGFLNGRINGTLDIYQRNSTDLIMNRQIPSTSGWSSIWDNVGKTRNRGIELGINTVNIRNKHFTWSTTIIFDRNKNTIQELYGQKKDDVANKWFIGQPISVNYDYEFDGIWQNSEADLAAKYGQTPGQVRVKDLNNDGVINAEDKKVIGQLYPKWTGSITNSFNYRDLDLTFQVYTRQGAQMRTYFMSSFCSLTGDYKNLNVNYWMPDNPSNDYPQPGNSGKYNTALNYQSVSFVRVGYITLGYSLPQSMLKNLNIKKLRFYFTTNNPFTFTHYKGYDPEWATQDTWGEATGSTTYMIGANLQF